MKKSTLLFIIISSCLDLNAQWGANLILNNSFENGSVPPGPLTTNLSNYVSNWEGGCYGVGVTPDVFDPNAPNCSSDPSSSVDVPNNMWGSISPALGSRYVGFSHSEPVMGQLSENLIPGCEYRLRLKAACSTNMQGDCGLNNTSTSPDMVIEVKLRNSSNPCSMPALLLFTSGTFNSTTWNYFDFTFIATAAMSTYDRIEFRCETTTYILGLPYWKPVFLDDVGLEKSLPAINLNPGADETICDGEFITINSTGSGTWTSSPADPTLSGQETNNVITVSPSVTTTYTFTTECFVSNSITIYVVSCAHNNYCFAIDKPEFRDVGTVILQEQGADFVFAGAMEETGNDKDVYVARLDEFLNPVNNISTIIGDETGSSDIYREEGYTMLIKNGKYYVAGSSYDINNSNYDIYLTRIDALTGTVDWEKTYSGTLSSGAPSDEIAVKILDASLEGVDRFLIIGNTTVVSESTYDIFAMKIDPDGTLISTKIYNYTSKNLFKRATDALIINGTTECVIAGYGLISTGDMDMIGLKIDHTTLNPSSGWLLMGRDGDDYGFGIEQHGNLLYFVGKSNSYNTLGYDEIFLAEIGSNFVPGVLKTYGYSGHAQTSATGYKIKRLTDDDIVIVGEASDSRDSDGIILRIKFNPGNFDHLTEVWSRRTYMQNNDAYYNLTEPDPQNLLLIGKYGPSDVEEDIFIVRMSQSGNSCCMNQTDFFVETVDDVVSKAADTKNISWTPRTFNDNTPYFSPELICEDFHSHHRKEPGTVSMNLTSGNLAQDEILLYPNPASTQFTVELLNEGDDIKEIILMDFIGKTVTKTSNHSKNNTIDMNVSQLNNGIYFLEVITSANQKFTTKIAISK